MRDLRFTLVTSVLLALVAGCGDDDGSSESPNAIHIGALTDETGPSASPLYRSAVNLARQHINQALEAAGESTRFNVVFEDSQSNGPHSMEMAAELINNEGVVGLVTDISGDSLAVNTLNYQEGDDRAADYQVPVACYLCSAASLNNPGYTDMDPVKEAAARDGDGWLFRTFFNAKYEAVVQTQILLNQDGGDLNGDDHVKIAVYAIDDAYGQSAAKAVQESADELTDGAATVEVVFLDPTVDVNSYDWGDDLATLMDESNETTGEDDGEPDALFLALLSLSSSAAVKAYREAEYEPPLFATTAFRRNHILRALGDTAEGVQGNSPPLVADDISGETFKEAFEQGGEPTEMGCSGAYDSAMALMLASLHASVGLEDPSTVTADAVRASMAAISDPDGELINATPEDFEKAVGILVEGGTIRYSGASGATNYDAAGDASPVLVHWTVENQKFVESESYACSAEDPLCSITE
jgi:ABC-type branched-subunit amino acid transport system substrate-binding protein